MKVWVNINVDFTFLPIRFLSGSWGVCHDFDPMISARGTWKLKSNKLYVRVVGNTTLASEEKLKKNIRQRVYFLLQQESFSADTWISL